MREEAQQPGRHNENRSFPRLSNSTDGSRLVEHLLTKALQTHLAGSLLCRIAHAPLPRCWPSSVEVRQTLRVDAEQWPPHGGHVRDTRICLVAELRSDICECSRMLRADYGALNQTCLGQNHRKAVNQAIVSIAATPM